MKYIISYICMSIFFILPVSTGYTQEEEERGVPGEASAADPESLPPGFRGIVLGMEMEGVKEELERDVYFNYRGEPDVSMLARPATALIEVEGSIYIERAFFQFDGEILYTIIINLNRRELDYYSLYTHLTGKYGEPDSLDPDKAVWENDEVRMSLERPLSVKYIDLEVFERIRSSSRIEESYRAASRKEFLEMF